LGLPKGSDCKRQTQIGDQKSLNRTIENQRNKKVGDLDASQESHGMLL